MQTQTHTHEDEQYQKALLKSSIQRRTNTSNVAYLGNRNTEEDSIGKFDEELHDNRYRHTTLFHKSIDQQLTLQTTKLLIEDYKLSRKLGEDPHKTMLFSRITEDQKVGFQFIDQYKSVVKDKRKLLQEKKAITDKCTAKTTDYFITITVPRENDKLFYKYITEKLQKLICFREHKYYICIEWQKPDSEEGMHAHILLPKGGRQPTDVKKCINNSYKSFFKVDKVTPVQIQYSHVQNETGYDIVYSYIHGDKTNDKMAKVEKCSTLREIYGIPDVITNPDFEY